MSKIVLRALPFLVFFVLVVFLWRGLFLDPREIPSSYLGKQIPKFSLSTLNRKRVFKDTDLYGKISLLNVWASWCMACKEEQVFLLKLADSGIKIYGLNYKDNSQNALNWLATWGNPYDIVAVDVNGTVAFDLGVYGAPETFLIDKHGIIRYRYAGILDEKIWQEKFLPIIDNELNNEVTN